MTTNRSTWALTWRPGAFLVVSLFLAGDLADDLAREGLHPSHVRLDVLTLSIALTAFVVSAWQSWRALRQPREPAASRGDVSGASPRSVP